jgi:hypothetical protein
VRSFSVAATYVAGGNLISRCRSTKHPRESSGAEMRNQYALKERARVIGAELANLNLLEDNRWFIGQYEEAENVNRQALAGREK